MLQIVSPKGSWTDDADALRDQFLDAFNAWSLADASGRLRVYRMAVERAEQADAFITTCRVYWQSRRRP